MMIFINFVNYHYIKVFFFCICKSDIYSFIHLFIHCRASTQLTVEILDVMFLTAGNHIVHLMTIQMTVRHLVFVLNAHLILTEGHLM
jgi:hypothetical protein